MSTKVLALENVWPNWLAKPQTRHQKKLSIAAGWQVNWRGTLAAGLAVLNVILLLSYVYGVNQYATAGFEIKTLQKKVDDLNEDNRKISLKVSEANSMISIQSDFLNSNFVAAGTPQFLQFSQYSMK